MSYVLYALINAGLTASYVLIFRAAAKSIDTTSLFAQTFVLEVVGAIVLLAFCFLLGKQKDIIHISRSGMPFAMISGAGLLYASSSFAYFYAMAEAGSDSVFVPAISSTYIIYTAVYGIATDPKLKSLSYKQVIFLFTAIGLIMVGVAMITAYKWVFKIS